MRRKMEFHRKVEVFLQLQLTLEPKEVFTDNSEPPSQHGREGIFLSGGNVRFPNDLKVRLRYKQSKRKAVNQGNL